MSKDRFLTIIICAAVIIFGITFKMTPVISYHAGQNALKKQDYVKAYKNLKRAHNFDKNNKDYRYYYVQSMKNIPATVQIQKEVFEISADSQRDSAQQSAEEQAAKWRMNVLTNIGDNYIEQAPSDKGIIRWDIDKFPLTISIKNESGIDVPSYYMEEIKRALSQWQTSIDFLKFAITDKKANIVIKISPTPDNLCTQTECRYVVGFTTPDVRGNSLHKMTITLYTKDPNGNFFSDKELYNTILHEIGHALGIMGHSYSSDDLMYMNTDNNKTFYAPYRSSFQYLSSKDINTIKLLYKLTPAITNSSDAKGSIYAPIVLGTSEQISIRKLKEAQNYIKNAPDLAGGYMDLGIAYAELNKKKEAIKAMEKAFNLSKTQNEKYLAAYNLAVIHLENKDFQKAETFANLAGEISNSEEVKDLLTKINHEKNK